MEEDKGKNFSCKKGGNKTKDWIKLDGSYKLLILCSGVWVSPIF